MRGKVWLGLGLIYLTWGSLYLGIRLVVEDAPPMVSMALRFAGAGAVMLAFLAARDVRRLRASRRQVLGAFGLGALLLGVGNGMNAFGQVLGVPSGVTALLCATVPLFVTVLRVMSGRRPHALSLLGVVVGMCGVAYLILGDGAVREGSLPAWGVLSVLTAALGWSLGSYFQPRVWRPADVLASTTYQLLGAALFLVVLSRVMREPLDLDMGATAWGALVYLIIVGSIVSFTVYQWLLGHAPLELVATHTYVNPVVAVALGAMVLGETLGPAVILGGGAVVLSVVLTVVAETRIHARDRTGAEVRS
ncbi:EamA family transporter [Janibacter sp. YIM B02568]|uniref:EamA family transporter n=1 Tax=Janibacter endophyticus TaxID=2806261 RepID=UPI0019509A11|nr:EamA family transporter [Janibacter endophyticus]MBM6545446.1 EamA family transporter [Janibacter endophyticus]